MERKERKMSINGKKTTQKSELKISNTSTKMSIVREGHSMTRGDHRVLDITMRKRKRGADEACWGRYVERLALRNQGLCQMH